mmetsp:Transcript_40479/g.114644  ORF Transcript_40479/g.114644 Transcript_40479/m.114644 type:complete len:415 (+) Transcript_40479:364-1608(+)
MGPVQGDDMQGVFDLSSYLNSDPDMMFLDGWDVSAFETVTKAGDGSGYSNMEGVATTEADAGGGGPRFEEEAALLTDDVLDDLFRQQQLPEQSDPHNPFGSAEYGSHQHTGDGDANQRSNVTEPSQGQLEEVKAELGVQTEHKNGFATPAPQDGLVACMPPPTTLGQVLAASHRNAGNASANVSSATPASSAPKSDPSGDTGRRSGSKRRRVEDPSVIDMARKLLEARSNEQAAMLSNETSTLSADNHRLIIYLKQLGEKLEKARIENSFLKKLVMDNGGQPRADRAQELALVEDQEAPHAKKPMYYPSTMSVADKVSALSVQGMHEDGTPMTCLRSTSPVATPPTPPAPEPVAPLVAHAKQMQGLMMPSDPELAAAAASAIQANKGNPTGALVDLLRLVEMQLHKQKSRSLHP